MPLAKATKAPAVSREAFVAAFYPWVESDPLRALYNRIKDNKPAMTLLADAIEQAVEMRVASYDHWWHLNHWRYSHLREIDRRDARECVRAYFAQVQLGRIKL